jgi:hypothetical protein
VNIKEICTLTAFTTAVGTVHLGRSRFKTTIVFRTPNIEINSPVFAIASHYVFILLSKHVIYLSFDWLLMMQ